jgi:hypothetical protein
MITAELQNKAASYELLVAYSSQLYSAVIFSQLHFYVGQKHTLPHS